MFEYRGIIPRIKIKDDGWYEISMDEFDIFVYMPSIEDALGDFRLQTDDYFDKKETTY